MTRPPIVFNQINNLAQRRFDPSPVPSATCPRETVLPILLRPDFLIVFKGYAGAAKHWSRRQDGRKRSLRADILQSRRLREFGSERYFVHAEQRRHAAMKI